MSLPIKPLHPYFEYDGGNENFNIYCPKPGFIAYYQNEIVTDVRISRNGVMCYISTEERSLMQKTEDEVKSIEVYILSKIYPEFE